MLRPYVFACTFFPRAHVLSRMTELKRSLRLTDGLAMVVGMTVGAGIFRTARIVAARLGRPGLTFVVWVLGAALAFLGALCFAELTTLQPNAAGKYAFVREAFGPRAGFVVGWVEALGTNGVAIAAIGVAGGEFLVRLAGWPPALIAPLGAGLVALFTGINLVGVASGRWVQNVVTAAKLLALGGVVVIAFARGTGAGWHGELPGAHTAARAGGRARCYRRSLSRAQRGVLPGAAARADRRLEPGSRGRHGRPRRGARRGARRRAGAARGTCVLERQRVRDAARPVRPGPRRPRTGRPRASQCRRDAVGGDARHRRVRDRTRRHRDVRAAAGSGDRPGPGDRRL